MVRSYEVGQTTSNVKDVKSVVQLNQEWLILISALELGKELTISF